MEISPNSVMKNWDPDFEVLFPFSKNSCAMKKKAFDFDFFLKQSSRYLLCRKITKHLWDGTRKAADAIEDFSLRNFRSCVRTYLRTEWCTMDGNASRRSGSNQWSTNRRV